MANIPAALAALFSDPKEGYGCRISYTISVLLPWWLKNGPNGVIVIRDWCMEKGTPHMAKDGPLFQKIMVQSWESVSGPADPHFGP